MLKLKRAYDPVSKTDGTRFLVERLWPRGLSKAEVHVDGWAKEVGPSTALRKWFAHDPEKWSEFRRRYFRELDARPEAWRPILSKARRGIVTLVYSSHDSAHNNAVALQKYLRARARRRPPAPNSRSAPVVSMTDMAPGTPRPLIVRPVPPFQLDLTVWALRRRARNAIDRWNHGTYQRIIILGGRVTAVSVRQRGSLDAPRLVVTSSPSPHTPAERRQLRTLIERLLGTRIDLDDWYRLARQDRRLGILADRFRGVKPPRFPTIFEAVVNAFACQQLSLEVGLELLNRLAAACAVRGKTAPDSHFGFPEASDVARLPPSRYRALGFSRQKVKALLALARAVEKNTLDLEALSNHTDSDACARLLELRGVGRWTAEYVWLRGLGRLQVFPGDDVGAQKRLARWLGRPNALDYDGVRRAVAKWQPYAGLVYFHLLLDGLMQTAALSAEPPEMPHRFKVKPGESV